ncbi:MAG: hypothetical protein ACKVOI_02320 [Dongiaceae bacterium]
MTNKGAAFRLLRIIYRLRTTRFLTYQAMLAAAICAFAAPSAVAQDGASFHKYYSTIDGKVDARTYNGFRRFHTGCNHCRGMDAVGSAFGPR